MLRRLAPLRWLLAFSLAAGCASSGAYRPDETVLAGESAAIPSTTCKNLFLVETWIGDAGPFQFVLDTGAAISVVDWRVLEAAGVVADAAEAARAGSVVEVDALRLGGLGLRGLPVRGHDMQAISSALGTRADGIVGFPAFAEVVLVLDYPQRSVRVRRGGLPPEDGRRVFAYAGSHRPYLGLRTTGAAEPVLLDSGAAGGLVLGGIDGFAFAVEPRPVSMGMKFVGTYTTLAGRLAGEVRIGPIRLEEPLVTVREEGIHLLGGEVLRDYRVSFDQRAKRVQFERRAGAEQPERAFRGLGIGLLPDGPRAFEVVAIYPGSQAAAAGLEVGDRVIAFDELGPEAWGCGRWQAAAQERGRVTLAVVRGEDVVRIEIPLVDLVP